MLGTIVKYAGGCDDSEKYAEFADAVGYIIGSTHHPPYGEVVYEIKWFKPVVVMGGLKIEKSHFTAARFEVLTGEVLSDETSR